MLDDACIKTGDFTIHVNVHLTSDDQKDGQKDEMSALLKPNENVFTRSQGAFATKPFVCSVLSVQGMAPSHRASLLVMYGGVGLLSGETDHVDHAVLNNDDVLPQQRSSLI